MLVTDAGGFDYDFVAFGDGFAGDGHLSVERDVHDDEAGRFRIDLDDARTIAQTKPAAGDRAFFDHHSVHGDTRRGIAGFDCENTSQFSFWRFAKDGSLRFMTTGRGQEANQ
jgi:hypothetical protein